MLLQVQAETLNTLEAVVAGGTILALGKSAYNGLIRKHVESIEEIPNITKSLKEANQNHEEIKEELGRLHHGQQTLAKVQVAQAKAINEGRELDIKSIRAAHPDDDKVPEDFLSEE